MTTEIERRVGNLLDNSESRVRVPEISSSEATEATVQRGNQSSADGDINQPVFTQETDSTKEKLSLELKVKQDKMKVHNASYAAPSF